MELKTEQESKRLREAQGRRIRRSQSINTRTQSVRRTSIRDKVLTTKKDAQEEARLRIQAQQVKLSCKTFRLVFISSLSSSFVICCILFNRHTCHYPRPQRTRQQQKLMAGQQKVQVTIPIRQHSHQMFGKVRKERIMTPFYMRMSIKTQVHSEALFACIGCGLVLFCGNW